MPPSDTCTGIARKSSSDLQVAARAHHVLGLGELDHRAAGLAVGVADRGDHLRERQVVRLEPRRDRRRPGTAAPCRRPSPPRRRSARVFSSYLRNQSCSARSCARSCSAGAIDERVFVDPADAGRVGPERRLRRRRKPALHLVQVLEHARARPVEVGAVLEQHVDERIAEERVAAHGLRARAPTASSSSADR